MKIFDINVDKQWWAKVDIINKEGIISLLKLWK